MDEYKTHLYELARVIEHRLQEASPETKRQYLMGMLKGIQYSIETLDELKRIEEREEAGYGMAGLSRFLFGGSNSSNSC